ncbi:MAG: hypothetical protein CMK46_06965 [Porticoccus sp.]|jgi:hypothetical protein|uniref:hypothetical protein n=1 Tax=Pseudomonadota TaxID=1224 RepID=UPI000C58D88B|nr:hypothetical protein [Rhodospirillaceae bacterium]MAY26193.1 hypothetical protein [Polycyclovorans sp.]MBG58014.1 hypothetical protein [Porticoccus sp.]QDP49881.1 MAG: hypothetical protein GOVbin132_25 [Prokaryotic dsDNA virus sp.]MAX61620.1 hypothetical protein [Rhodospirillaceae bacterium]|tara:strand:+ start:27160 stop:27510 length:351 start_codon:yes stop_codon:yes gene_type:complete
MSAFYDRLNATAQRLISTYGKAATVVRLVKTGPAHAPVITDDPYPCQIVEAGYKLSLISETLIQVGDKMGLISTTIAIVPDTKDKIVIDGARYNFAEVMPLNPGGTVLLYEFLARV